MNNTANFTNLSNFRKKKLFWRTLIVCCLLLPLLFLYKCGSSADEGAEGLEGAIATDTAEVVAAEDNAAKTTTSVASGDVGSAGRWNAGDASNHANRDAEVQEETQPQEIEPVIEENKAEQGSATANNESKPPCQTGDTLPTDRYVAEKSESPASKEQTNTTENVVAESESATVVASTAVEKESAVATTEGAAVGAASADATPESHAETRAVDSGIRQQEAEILPISYTRADSASAASANTLIGTTIATSTTIATGATIATGTTIATGATITTDAAITTDATIATGASVENTQPVESKSAIENAQPIESKPAVENAQPIESKPAVENAQPVASAQKPAKKADTERIDTTKADVASVDPASTPLPVKADTTKADSARVDIASVPLAVKADTTIVDTASVDTASVPLFVKTDTTKADPAREETANALALVNDTAVGNTAAVVLAMESETAAIVLPVESDTAVRVPFAPKKDVVALRTNLLYDAVLVPNIGIEVWLGKQFTLGADWFGTWLSSDKKHIFWQGYGGYLTLRYYFGKQAAERRFTGHHVGLYGSALTYDVEFGGKGYQAAKFGFGGGIEYGYSLPVHKCLTIDFNIGVGYQGGEYKTYQPTVDGTGHYVWLATYNRHWWGPTKAEISLKWLIAPVDKKKGGER